MAAQVCFFTDGDAVGGAEIAMTRQILSLDRERWNPVLLHHGHSQLAPVLDELAAADVGLVTVGPMPDGHGAAALPGFVARIRSLRPALFHAHLSWPRACKYGLMGALAARVPGVISTVHSFPDTATTRLAALEWRAMVRLIDHFLVPSHFGAGRLVEILPGAATKTSVVAPGIDVSAYERSADPCLRRSLAAGTDRCVVLVSARLDPLKGHSVLLRACSAMDDVQLVFAGEGPEREGLTQLAERLRMRDRVSFLGFRDDVPDLLAACDVLVLPTLHDAFPLSLLEGMAACRPVLSTRVGGPEEIVVDGETGLLVSPGDATALAHALRRVLDDAALASRLGAAARASVMGGFTFRSAAVRTDAVYDMVLSAKRRRARSRRTV